MFKMELDIIDKKIIYELGRNSRLSFKEIAKNINSKKEVVAYRFNQLIKNKVITKFVPVFALSKIGIFSSKIYIRLHGLNEESENKLYNNLLQDKDIIWVAKSAGRWDLLLGMYTKNIIDFSKLKEKILTKFGKYIKDYDITQIEEGLVFNRDYLINKHPIYRNQFLFGGDTDNITLKDIELKIINLIKNNARFKVLDIAEQLKIDPRTVMTIIKNLEKKRILQGYTVFLDLKKIGYQLHKLCIHFENYNKDDVEILITLLKQDPKIIHLIKSLGSWEIEIEIESNNLQDIYDFINKLKNKFPKLIKQIDLVTITEELKLNFFPEINPQPF
jgi:DNA-binding Lrp family transcriptional regulator